MQYQTREILSLDWVILLLVGCFVLVSVVKYLYPRRFQEFIQLPITDTYFLIQGKNDTIMHPFNMLLFLNQVIAVSLLIYVGVSVYKPEITTNPYIFIQIVASYTLFIAIKFCIEKIIAISLSIDHLVNKYLYQKLTYRNLIGLLIHLTCAILFFVVVPSKTIFISIAVVLLLLNCISLFYSYKKNSKLIFSHFFYFILYLCALEISPYILLYKIVL